MAVPRAIGSRIEAAGLAKTAAGRVRDGMKLVMIASGCYTIPLACSSRIIQINRIREGERSVQHNSFIVDSSRKCPTCELMTSFCIL